MPSTGLSGPGEEYHEAQARCRQKQAARRRAAVKQALAYTLYSHRRAEKRPSSLFGTPT